MRIWAAMPVVLQPRSGSCLDGILLGSQAAQKLLLEGEPEHAGTEWERFFLLATHASVATVPLQASV